MYGIPKQKSKWPSKSIVVISDSPNLHLLIRELLRSFDWKVVESTNSVKSAIETLRNGKAFLVIVDDTVGVPATSIIRNLLSDTIACTVPILSFLLEHNKTEKYALQKMGKIEIVEKPLTPSKFIPSFRNLLQTWESKPFIALRMASHQYLQHGPQAGLGALLRLNDIDILNPYASQMIAHTFRRNGKIQDAEKILLESIKKHPRNLSTMIALGDLYMNCALPKLSQRLFQSARTHFGDSIAIIPDLVQTAIFLGNLEEAYDYLQIMSRRGFMVDQTTEYLARVCYALGKADEAEKLLNAKKSLLEQINRQWQLKSEDQIRFSATG